ncbi:MAG: ribosome hibernation-promoting factor, HPF/YfiA family [Phycisphaerales bacterium]
MRIEVTGRGIELTDAIQSYADKKCEKLTRYYDGVQEIEAILDQRATEFTAEILVHAVKHDPFVARADGADVYAAIDQAVDKMARQLADFKDKLRRH